jgi:hypothetical protein
MYRQFIRPTLCKVIPHVKTAGWYLGFTSFVNSAVTGIARTLIVNSVITEFKGSGINVTVGVIAVFLRIPA